MKLRPSRFCSLAVLSLAMLGCGSNSNTQPDGGTADQVRTVCNTVFTAFSQRYSDCDGRPLAFGIAYNENALTEGQMASDTANECDLIAASAADGKLKLDAAQLATCEADIHAMTCNYLASELVNLPASCTVLFGGQVANKDSCTTSAECASGLCDNSESCPGTCIPADVSILPACASTQGDETCTVDQTCGTAQGSNTCVPRYTSGRCGATVDCAGGYECVRGAKDADFSCVKRLPVGATCTAGEHQCGAGLFCQAGVCASWPTTGGACGLIAGEDVGCLDSVCPAPMGGTDFDYQSAATCVARLPRGASCTIPGNMSNPCAPGNTCVKGTCTEYDCGF